MTTEIRNYFARLRKVKLNRQFTRLLSSEQLAKWSLVDLENHLDNQRKGNFDMDRLTIWNQLWKRIRT